MKLSPKDQATALAALRVAEQTYREDAAKMRVEGQDRIAEQFERQAKDAMRLTERMEECCAWEVA